MIYEDEENQNNENAPHVSYKEYQDKLQNKKSNESLILFVSAFFVMLLLFLGIVKHLSPEVDVSIADNDFQTASEDIEKGNIDDRLKSIQMEDTSYAKDDTFSPELEEKVLLPKQKRKTVGEKEAESIALEQPVQKPTHVEQSQPTVSIPAKVVVGYYATQEQAEVAKSIIQDAGLNIQPFVKNIGGAYTLQVGSFSSKEKAQSVANDLLRNNFPARVLIEN